jgi:hypothetical protein
MSHHLAIKAGALALATALIAPTGALAQDSSTNTSFLSPISFDANDPGQIILFMFNNCNAGPDTQMANGPFVRIAVADMEGGGGPVPGGGGAGAGGGGQGASMALTDSRLDYVTLDITSGITNPAGHSLSGTGISDQIGINPGVTLRVDITYSAATDIVSINDTSDADSQILDLGGFDAVMLFNGEQNNRVRTVCDMNMWRKVGGNPAYGVDVPGQTSLPSRIIVFWAAGPSAFAHQTLANAACDGVNIAIDADNNGETPLDASREAFTVGLGGDAALTYGDVDQPANYTACTGLASYCDATEPSPETPLDSDADTNLCNPAAGGGSPPNVSVLTVNEGNASCVKTVFGVTMRFEPCPPE